MHAPPTEVSRATRGVRWLLLTVIVAMTGCGIEKHMPLEPVASTPVLADPVASTSVLADPLLLRFDVDAPALESNDTSFVAVSGERMSFRVHFEGGSGSDRFLRLELHQETLWRFPPGHPRAGALFQPGDTITITVSIDPETLAVDFGPEGLEFNPDKPAELRLGYRFADPDFDGDGIPDPALEPTIRMFRQATPGDPWVPLDSRIDLLEDEVEFKDLTKFSRYALAI